METREEFLARRAAYMRERYRLNPERALAATKKCLARNRDKYLAHKREYGRKWRQTSAHKHSAHLAVQEALRKHIIVKPLHCQLCWDTTKPVEGHHEDYGKPLEIVWLCRRCHLFVDHHKIYRPRNAK